MTQNTGKMKVNEMAKSVLSSTKQSLDAISAMQHDIASKIEAVKKIESELLKRHREEEQAAKEQAQMTAEKPVETVAAEQAPKEEKIQEEKPVKAEKQQEPKKQEDVLSAPAAAKPAEAAAVPVNKVKEESVPAAAAPAEPPKPAEQTRVLRPAELLALRQAAARGQMRDDAAIRNAQRQVNQPQRPSTPQRDGQRSYGDRPQRPNQKGQTARPNQGQYGDRPQRPAGQSGFSGQRNSQNSNRSQRPTAGLGIPQPVEATRKTKVSNYDPNKQNYVRVFDNEKKGKNRKVIDRELRAQQGAVDDEGYIRRRKKKPAQVAQAKPEPIQIDHAVITGDTVTVKTLADKIGKTANEIIKRLMLLGTIATINNEIDFETAALVASDFGIEIEQKIEQTAEDVLTSEDNNEDESMLVKRPPVVTIMGHVDHGKTSLLDKIRSSRVTEGEAGGITQHIGAYRVNCGENTITFLDTPGHEAFTAMRARGAQVTDAVILVVAADDGIMPQTVEAINHSKAAGVPIIVAVNKIDLPDANPERVCQELTEYGLVWEQWGGDTVVCPISAKTGEGIDNLLEMVLLVTDVLELKANPDRLARGTIVEAKLDKGRGPLATVLVQTGTLKVGQTVVAGTASGRIRAMLDEKGKRVTEAGPSTPVEVLGFDFVPAAGDLLYAVDDSSLTRQVVEERRNRIKSEQMKMSARASLDDLFNQIKDGQTKDLNIIVKADVQGSVEAVRSSLEKLSNDQVRIHCIHGGAGAIVATDVMLASASNAIIIGFNVRPDGPARTAAEKENVDIRLYRVIYSAIEDMEKAMKGMLAPVFEEVVLGHAQIREIYRVSSVGSIAGCMVQDGKMVRNAKVRLLRDNIVVYEGQLASLRRFKDDVREVMSGYECGLSLTNYNDIKEGDIVEAFMEQEVKQD